MEIKVKEVPSNDLSRSEREQRVQEPAEGAAAEGAASAEAKKDAISEQDVLEFFKTQKNHEFSSLDEVLTPREVIKEPELPEDVRKYMDYKKETGRGYKDFLAFQESFEDKSEDQRLSDYLLATEQGLDKEDIEVLMAEFEYDEDIDDEDHVKKIKLKKKKAIAQAKDWFNQNKERYGVRDESSQSLVPEDEKEQYEAFKQYIESANTEKELVDRKREVFVQKTDEVFSQDFKGFDFEVGGKKITFSPGAPEDLKKSQLDTTSFVSKFLDENGMVKDAKGYHKALSAAMNPDKLAKFFYDQGAADAIDKHTKGIKNIDMGVNQARQSAASQSGFSVRAVNSEGDKSFKVKAKN